jgi:ABC-type Fe3+-hydroxamate transport system substrate-binding protein
VNGGTLELCAGRRALLGLFGLGLLGCSKLSGGGGSEPRLVSLAPAVTDTLFAIGAGPNVVAVSDYCDYPPEAQKLPRVGTNLTPNYEAIARLRPTWILGQGDYGSRKTELEALGRTLLLPWLSLSEITNGIEELGRVTGHAEKAAPIARELRGKLGVPEPKDGPRVLLMIGYDPARLDEIWFIRRNSLHGALLHAAGGRNAVPEQVTGMPRISPERLIELDPDAIIVLARPEKVKGDFLAALRQLEPLRAVKAGRLDVLAREEVFVYGPRVLSMLEPLRTMITRLRGLP